MAGRARTIKAEILADEKTALLSHLEWRLFVSSWLIADDHGNLRSEPAYIRSHTLWAADEPLGAVAQALETLASVSLLTRYTVRGQSYFHITNWTRHQRVDRPSKRQMPGPEEAARASEEDANKQSQAVEPNPREGLAEQSRDPTESLDTPSRDPSEPLERPPRGPRETLALDRKGKERREKPRADRAPLTPLPAGFAPDPELRQVAADRGVDFDHELEKFRAWTTAQDRRSRNWQAYFHKWLLDSRPSDSPRKSPQPASPTGPVRRSFRRVDGTVQTFEYTPDGEQQLVEEGPSS